ncbi:glycosyltransferase [Aquabacter sp. L1I39]|uniref:glycosyltransferase n=1 Tax=Aquabacter sp. L1I39 TaxID=2820278 RepID=UPI001FFC8229|nr:glycosyltransferase [Aquabacter sp. L1I39]
MISVIIPTSNSERELVPVLSALVPGVTAGILREVVLVDAGSTDGTPAIADAAGCALIQGSSDMGQRLRQGVSAVRTPWVLFLQPDSLLEEGWSRDVGQFLETAERRGAADRVAATFRLAVDGYGLRPRIRELAGALQLAVLGRARSGQGLLISRRHYERLNGHRSGAASEQHLATRLRRHRLHVLRARVVLIADQAEAAAWDEDQAAAG